MSYCRWSSDNWKCDLYCYEDVSGGWTTHVAGSRRVGTETLPPEPLMLVLELKPDEWRKRYQEHRDALGALPFEEITLPHAGESFSDDSLESFKARLLYLRGLGYHFPDYVLETVDEEMADVSAKERNAG